MNTEVSDSVKAFFSAFGIYVLPIAIALLAINYQSWVVAAVGMVGYIGLCVYVEKKLQRSSDKPFSIKRFIVGIAIIVGIYAVNRFIYT